MGFPDHGKTTNREAHLGRTGGKELAFVSARLELGSFSRVSTTPPESISMKKSLGFVTLWGVSERLRNEEVHCG
jgi:hypothetical protein